MLPCRVPGGSQPQTEHYNSPEELQGIPGSCSYTEWIVLDNGVNGGGSVRPLTIWDSTVENSPPWGAPRFANAPVHAVLRISTGASIFGSNVSIWDGPPPR